MSFIAAHRLDMGVAYGATKAADDQMAACMAHELRPRNVAAVHCIQGWCAPRAC